MYQNSKNTFKFLKVIHGRLTVGPFPDTVYIISTDRITFSANSAEEIVMHGITRKTTFNAAHWQMRPKRMKTSSDCQTT